MKGRDYVDNKEIVGRLNDEISDITLPPIPKTVFEAVREQKEKYNDFKQQEAEFRKLKKSSRIRFIVSAVIIAAAASLTLGIIAVNRNLVSETSRNESDVIVNSDGSHCEADGSSFESKGEGVSENESVLDKITLTKRYGDVALSEKGEDELEKLMMNYSSYSSIYEDSKYLYSFDVNGLLTEIVSISEDVGDGPEASEKEILDYAQKLLKDYFPEFTEGYSTDTDHAEDAYPAWRVSFIKKDKDLCEERIVISFDKTGEMLRVIRDGHSENLGTVSKSEAVAIALNEIRNGDYDVFDFDDRDARIVVNNKEVDNKVCYQVYIGDLPYQIVGDAVFRKSVSFLVDPDSGECTLESVSL